MVNLDDLYFLTRPTLVQENCYVATAQCEKTLKRYKVTWSISKQEMEKFGDQDIDFYSLYKSANVEEVA